ncbi:MAG: YiiD C-terminal domain-containing protein [Pseudomonadota bacterium]
MTPYDMIKSHLDQAVPFAKHVGVVLQEIGDGTASAMLEQRSEIENHIQTQHAGAMFTLGEAASGAAMAGALAPIILGLRPVARNAKITYKKIAKGTLTAHAACDQPGQALQDALKAEGKADFEVKVDIRDAEDDTVVEMAVTWHVRSA